MLFSEDYVINVVVGSEKDTDDGTVSKYVIIIYPDQSSPFKINYAHFLQALNSTRSTIKSHEFDSQDDIPIQVRLSAVISLFRKHGLPRIPTTERCVFVQSQDPVLLDMPWEQIFQTLFNVPVIRVYESNEEHTFSHETSMFIAISHASGGVVQDIRRDITNEIKRIFNLVPTIEENEQPSKIRIENVHLLQHTSNGLFASADLRSYEIIHFIMHGLSNGSLVFEDSSDYKHPSDMTVDQILNILTGSSHKLIFLSTCYSGGLTAVNASLCSRLIVESVTDCAIGYNQKSGGLTAIKVTEDFYRRLYCSQVISTETIIKAFVDTISSVLSDDKYQPVMYIRQNNL